LANALVLKGLLVGKAALVGGLLAAGSRGSSSSSSHHHRPSYSKHHRGKRSPLFFDGGATITIGAGLANALVLKGLLVGKAAVVGGLLAAGSSGSSRSSSHHYRPSYSKHHRGKRSPLFFDGGATITIGAGLANALVLKGLLVGKAAVVGGLLAAGSRGRSRSSSHHHRGKRSPLFFDGGATVTVGAGLANALVLKGLLVGKAAVVGGLLAAGSRGSSRTSSYHHRRRRSPLFFDGGATVTIGAAGLANALVLKGLIAAKVAVLGGALALASRGSRSSHSRHHGKRSAEYEPEITALLENTFLGMVEEENIGCFERLFCEMGADPASYQDNVSVSMAAAVKASSDMQFNSPVAADAAAKLNEAMTYPKVMTGQSKVVYSCEAAYNQCQWSGKAMKAAIAQVEKYEELGLAINAV